MTAKCRRFGPDTAQFNAKLAIKERPVSTSWETDAGFPFQSLEITSDADKLGLTIHFSRKAS